MLIFKNTPLKILTQMQSSLSPEGNLRKTRQNDVYVVTIGPPVFYTATPFTQFPWGTYVPM